MKVCKKMKFGGTMMGMSDDEIKKSRKKRERDAYWRKIFNDETGYWNVF